MKTYRASQLPRLFRCPGSDAKPSIQVEDDSEPARLGTAVHDAIADYITSTGDEPRPEMEAYAAKHGLKESRELKFLYWQARKTWDYLHEAMPDVYGVEVQMEIELDGVKLTGRPDVVALGEDEELVVIDWKSGWMEGEYRDQLMGYYALATKMYGVHEKGKRITVMLREQTLDVVDITPADLEAWLEKLQAVAASDERCAGGHCMFCPLRGECDTYRQYIQNAAAAILPFGQEKTELSPEEIAALRTPRMMLGVAIKEYDKVLKATITDHGPQPIGDGREITLIEQSRDTITYNAATHKAMAGMLGGKVETEEFQDRIGDFLTFRKTAYLDAVGKLAPRGQKGASKEMALEDLKDVGSLETVQYAPKLQARKIRKEKA